MIDLHTHSDRSITKGKTRVNLNYLTQGCTTVITGNCGPNAMQVIMAAGVQVYLGQSGTVRDIVEAYKNGRLTGMITIKDIQQQLF